MKTIQVSIIFVLSWLIIPTAFANPGIDNLTLIGKNGHQFAHVMDVRMKGEYAYASIGWNGGLETYSLNIVDDPEFVNATGSAAWRTKIFGDLLISFNRRAGLEFYQLSEGAAPSFISDISTGGTMIGFESGHLVGSTLYVAAHQTGIVPIDVSNPQDPIAGTPFDLATNDAWGMDGNSEYLFIANGRAGISVMRRLPDLLEIATLELPGLCNDIILDGNIIYLALGGDGIAAVSILDPENPVLLDIAPTMGNAFSLGLEENLLIVGAWRYLELYDVSNPSDISMIGWDHTRTYAMGADIGLVQNEPLISVADWRGISTYKPEPDTGPDIDVVPARVDFGDYREQDISREVSILNNGSAELIVNSVDLPAGVSIQPDMFSVAPGGALIVTLTVSAGVAVRGFAQYNSNDPDELSWTQYLYANDETFPHVGSKAPDFTLSDGSGTEYSLSDFRGSVVALQWGASW